VELVAGLIPRIVRAASRGLGANPGAAIDLLDALLPRCLVGVPLVGPDDLLHMLPQSQEGNM